jgi:hypothetical protein
VAADVQVDAVAGPERMSHWTPRELEDLKEAFLALYQIVSRLHHTQRTGGR